MAPSAGHLHKLVAKNAKLFRSVLKSITNRLPTSLRPATQPHLQSSYARLRQPIHPVAYLKQGRGRWYTTQSTISATVRRFTTSTPGQPKLRYDRASFLKSRIGDAANKLPGRSPFASTLRPNLTGGTLGRTAGGYALGSGRIGAPRFFSHTPTAPAQVIHNVSQAVRCFIVSGQKARFDGISQSGEKRYKTVTALQEDVRRKMCALLKSTPGSYVDFNIAPTITALSPLGTAAIFSKFPHTIDTLNSEGLLDSLSVDFSRALRDLATILNDLKRLSELGDLPITYHSSTLRVHFPGVDSGTTERLCDELGVLRGIVRQDEDFDASVGAEIALLFPFAPTGTDSCASSIAQPRREDIMSRERIEWRNMITPELETLSSPDISTISDPGMFYEDITDFSPWLSSPSGYESLHSSEADEISTHRERRDQHNPLDYRGFEGIYRFMEQYESAAR